MTLSAIVRAIGGDLYEGGLRAVIPGPGHSRHDRSVSLLLSEGRIVVHSFGRSTWREVMDELRARGLVDSDGRPAFGLGTGWSAPAPQPDAARIATAVRLWSEAQPLERRHALAALRLRGVIKAAPVSSALRHHGRVPLAVYAGRGPRGPALLAAVTDVAGALCAVEVTYLDPSGARAAGLRISRKIIGVLPPACAVRLDAPGPDLLVGEGVFTTLSASARFGLPGWALLSTRNLRTWAAPAGVERVLIAGDRGVDGERSAQWLRRRLILAGVEASVAWPPDPFDDWNDAEAATRPAGDRGRAGEDAPSGRMVRSPVRDPFR